MIEDCTHVNAGSFSHFSSRESDNAIILVDFNSPKLRLKLTFKRVGRVHVIERNHFVLNCTPCSPLPPWGQENDNSRIYLYVAGFILPTNSTTKGIRTRWASSVLRLTEYFVGLETVLLWAELPVVLSTSTVDSIPWHGFVIVISIHVKEESKRRCQPYEQLDGIYPLFRPDR